MKLKSLLVFMLFTTLAFSQDETPKKVTNDWEKSIAFHGGIGVQKSVFTELGISKFYLMDTGYFPLSKAYFASVEFSPTLKPEIENHIYGLKVGCEYSALILSFALEAKFQTDLEMNDFTITPKVGLGSWGVVTLYYGYNIPVSDDNFSRIGSHQFAVVCNLNKKIINTSF